MTTGSTGSRCPHGAGCRLRIRSGHGSWGWLRWMDLTSGHHLVKRFGFPLEKDAATALAQVNELLSLDADPLVCRKIGDLIVGSTLRGGPVPYVETVRLRLGAGLDPASPDVLTGEFLSSWLAGKRALKQSTRRGYAQHIAGPLTALAMIPLRRLRAEQIAGRLAELDVSDATRHRILATLRAACNAAVRQRLIMFNPCNGVELAPEERQPARVYGPVEVGRFLEHAETAGHRYALLYRLVLLRGLRRGEACGLRWQDLDIEPGHLRITQEVLELGGRIVFDTPKSKTSRRVVSLDSETTRLIKAHQAAQRRERFAAGPLYADGDLIFCNQVGEVLRPGHVSAEFKRLARGVGLPAIKLHEGRHSAATLALEAGLDIKVVSAQLGHSQTSITHDLYQHVRQVVADDAAERVAALLPPRKAAQRTP
jgi:integrase